MPLILTNFVLQILKILVLITVFANDTPLGLVAVGAFVVAHDMDQLQIVYRKQFQEIRNQRQMDPFLAVHQAHIVLHFTQKSNIFLDRWQNISTDFDLMVQIPDLKQDQIFPTQIRVDDVCPVITTVLIPQPLTFKLARICAQGYATAVEILFVAHQILLQNIFKGNFHLFRDSFGVYLVQSDQWMLYRILSIEKTPEIPKTGQYFLVEIEHFID